jgi:cysteine desulfurase family protein
VNLIYLDNAATTWPKPEGVLDAMKNYMENTGGSPGRSGHRLSIEAARIVYSCRERISRILGADDPLRIIFTKNATEALNIATTGLLKPGDHVITSGMEHNSVMRPLRALESSGVEISVVNCSQSGGLDPGDIKKEIKSNTRALYLTHASNVTGDIMPVEEAGKIADDRGLVFCVDAAQTAGALKIDVKKMRITLLAFTGHKSLFGPQGTGGLYIDDSLEGRIAPLLKGGTGSFSESELQPDFMPDIFEAGTLNTVGIAGLDAGAAYLLEQGIENIREHETALTERVLQGLAEIEGVRVYGSGKHEKMMPVISFTIEGMSPSDVAMKLDEEYGILSRPGLQCAPSAHRTLGTFPEGTVRISFGLFNNREDVDRAIEAISEIVRKKLNTERYNEKN